MNRGRPPGVIGRFVRGFLAPVRGARFLLGHPRLWKFVALPIAINVVIVSILLVLGFHFMLPLIEGFMPHGGQWYWAVLTGVVQIVVIIALFFIVALIFYLLSGILSRVSLVKYLPFCHKNQSPLNFDL